ncbi:cubilin homolog [Drosophila busckii]|nr:cubilin homolog [Drosophila busckii]
MRRRILQPFGLSIAMLLGMLCPAQSIVNSPKIISKDGNLIFESGSNRNISFKLRGSSRLIINEQYDVLELLMPLSGNKKRPGGAGKDEWSAPDEIYDLRELTEHLNEFKSQTFGVNGINARIRQFQNKRLQARLRTGEQNLQRLRNKLDLDSCQSNPCKNGGSCFNTYGGYRCLCRPAFEGSNCERDVNECVLFDGTDLGCQNGAQCVNQFGSFNCLCTPGWHGTHCSRRKTDCAAASAWELCGHGSCVPTSDVQGYRCLCEPGWRSNPLTLTCTDDVDECSDAAAHTPCTTKCINLPGSFTCAPCPPGLTGNGVSCRDINECETNNGGCSLSPRVECINSYGSSHCGECPVGWTGDGRSCIRDSSSSSSVQNNCAQRGDLCHPNASCSEISGTIICSCPSGMVGSGYGRDGCRTGSYHNCNDLPCLNGGTCTNTRDGNYTCQCPPGFVGPRCNPLPNVCDTNPCKNGATCRSTPSTSDRFVCQCLPGYRGRLCETRFSSCSRMLTGASGSLRYPAAGDSYDHNAQCAWVIRTNESLVLNVTFQHFHLEDSTECRFDWLQVNDGRSAAAQLIGRYCGNHIPHGGNIISSSNQLYLWFRSDNSTAHEGFELSWTSMPPRCGGRLEFETHGTLASPGSPGNYPRNRDCEWHLVAPSDKRIKLTFFSLQLEQHDSCNFDYLTIQDGISERELAKYCSSATPAPLLLPTHDVLIRFHSDETGSDLGFQLHYSVEQSVPGCGGTYSTPTGVISSPSSWTSDQQQQQQQQRISCEYEIRLALGEAITIEFVKFALPPDACLELYDVSNDPSVGKMLQVKHCGSGTTGDATSPPSFRSMYNRVSIRFFTLQAAGQFELHYRRNCEYTYDASTGVISSPGYPKLASNERLCSYKILTPANTQIILKRLDFQLLDASSANDLEPTEEQESAAGVACAEGTQLTINAGLNQEILGPYCNARQPAAEYLSRSNMLVLQLHSQANSHGRGFKFEYNAVPVNDAHCGGVYTKPDQHIRLGTYEDNMNCYWMIMAPPGKSVLLHWLSFDLESSNDCLYDYVAIYDELVSGDNDQQQPLSTHCGSGLPPDQLTQAQILTVKFVSDFSDVAGGFELAFSFVERDKCGGHIHSSTGQLISPEYPLNYSHNLDCVWRLTVPLGNQLELQTEMFQLQATPSCSGDYLEVRNGGSNSSALIGRYCGSNMPRRLPSYTHELYLHFHTDHVGSGRGFRLAWRIYGRGCGGRLPGNAGVISSPNYPAAYPHNAHCEWQLRVHPGSGVRLLLEDMDMEEAGECYFDKLSVYSGRLAGGHATLVQDMCEMPDEQHRQLEVTGNEATVVFNTDASMSRRGFRLSYSANCQRTLNEGQVQGVIESPNFGESGSFEGALNCSWLIKPPHGNRIHLEFSHFQRTVEREWFADPPGGLYLVDGARTLPILAAGAPNVSSDAIRIIHNSSAISFRLEFRVEGCLKELRAPTGSLESYKYPQMYPNDQECYWLIEASMGHVVELTVLDLDIEESVNCTKDALIISNSFTASNPHERHCGQHSKLIITSAGHQQHVRFSSDATHNGRGFQATYRIIESRCGGKLSSRSGVIESPGYPKPYPENMQCEWVVEVSPHHTIVFDMEDMDMELQSDCAFDFVAGFELSSNNGDGDGDSESLDDTEGRQIFKICSQDALKLLGGNDTRETTTNRAMVRFVTDSSVPGRGFRLHYRESCGQRVTIDETDFEYLSLRRELARNETCQWVLQASDPAKHIIFTSTHVQLHPLQAAALTVECLVHGIRIYEGVNASGTPRQQFCLEHMPALISNGNALTIVVPLSLVSEFEGHYMTMDTACGSRYTALSGHFASPYYPSSYPVNIECEWILEASEGNSLTLTITALDMERSDGCNNDYLEVRDFSSSGPLVGAYCGSQLPPSISSKGSLWLKFKSNDDVVGQGFRASYNYEHHNELNGTEGTIESPHYPTKFEASDPYSWRITVDTAYVVLVNVEHLRDVDQPHVRFWDGYADIGAQLHLREDKPLVSSTNVLFMKATRGPFRLTWQRLSKEALASNRSAEQQSRLCGQQLVTLSPTLVRFASPGYPTGYEPNLDCSWTLVAADEATHATLRLVALDLEQFGDECIADYLEISASTDMQHWRPLIKTCTQPNETASRVFQGTPYLRMRFVTDGSVNKTGFVTALRASCGGELTAPSGLVNITRLMMNNLMSQPECVWTIRVRRGKRVRITFPEFRLPSGGVQDGEQCRGYMMVRNGFAEDSPFLGRGKYCDNNITDVLVTSSNRAYIKFRRLNLPRILASFHYEELGDACSEQLVLDETDGGERIIHSPNYPNLPNPHTECIWRVTAPAHHRIAVDFFGTFDLTPNATERGCELEYVQLNDGATELMPQLGRYCGQTKPDVVISSGGELRIKFFTGVLEPHAGFQARIKLAQCGGSYYSTEGVIEMPDAGTLRPDLLRPARGEVMECVYTIEMERGSTIELTLTDVNLPAVERNEDCANVTHLRLEEMEPYGPQNEERVSDRVLICGTALRRTLLVETNKLIMRLRMPSGQLDRSLHFKLQYKAIGARCGDTIEANQGTLLTPNYPAGVTQPTRCMWRLRVPEGYVIKVTVLDFDTGASNRTHGVISHGRIAFANDFGMQSIIGRYTQNPPDTIYSMDNTMGVDAFLLPYNSHRGFKLRFQADGSSACSKPIDLDLSGQLRFTPSPAHPVVYCSYSLKPPANSTLLLQLLSYSHDAPLMSNMRICSVLSALKMQRPDAGEPLLPQLLCGSGSGSGSRNISSAEEAISVRLPFPIDLSINGNQRNKLHQLSIQYSVQRCGGMWPLELGDNLTIMQPPLPAEGGVLDCAWAVGPDASAEDPLEPQDVQLEVSVSVRLQGNCSEQVLQVYAGPDQNSPLVGRYCEQTTSLNLVVERGLFLEYHAVPSELTRNSTFNVSVKHGSGCGGKLTYPYRYIEFSEQYKNNVECVWEVEAEPGFHIGLAFLGRFYIEQSTNCHKDYLRVQQRDDNADGNWTDLQTLCGRDRPPSINSSSSALRLIFRSDQDTTGDGFFAVFERNCGGLLYATSQPQLLQSPGYPRAYDKNLTCNYTIQALEPHAAGVFVRFLEFDLENAPGSICMYDNVTVTTRDSWQPGQHQGQQSVLCGVKQRHEYRARQSVELVLRTDSSYSGRGFKLEYSTNLCGGVVNGTQLVSSPRRHQDDKMPHNSNCYWNLTAPEGYKWTVKFELLDFEAGNSECRYDGVELFASAVPDEKRRLARFCGRIKSELPTLHIAGNRGLLHSYSDDRDPSLGFRALVRSMRNCDERIQLAAHNASYSYNRFLGQYAPDLDCSVVFKAPPGYRLSIEFRSFHLELSARCTDDFVELRDGAGPFADDMGRFCGQQLPPNLSSSRNALFLRFVTDQTVSDMGFELLVEAKPLQCGNALIKYDGKAPMELHSPTPTSTPRGAAANGQDHVSCLWKIESDVDLHVQFLSVDLEPANANGSCLNNYLKFYTGEDAQLVEQGYGSEVVFSGTQHPSMYFNYAPEFIYCDKLLPDDYYPDSRQLYIKYRGPSSRSGNRTGFAVRLLPNESCEDRYEGIQGRIKFSGTADCNIFILSPANYTLSLYYTDVSFNTMDCADEHVEVYDMASNRSLQRACGSLDAGKSLFTHSNQLRVHLKTGTYAMSLDMTYIASPVADGVGCGGQLYNTEGIITNPFYPQNLRNNSDCRWRVRVPANTRVLLNFEVFNLGSSATCLTDYLQILETNDAGVEQQMRRYCGHDSPRLYRSQRSELIIRFRKTVNYDGIGWVIKFTGVHSEYDVPSYMLA